MQTSSGRTVSIRVRTQSIPSSGSCSISPILFAIGYVLLGLSLWRVKAYPAPPLWALVFGALLVGLWPLLPGAVQHLSAVVSLIYTAGAGWIGYLLARKRDVVV